MSSVAQHIKELIAAAWWDAISQDEQYIFLRDQRQYSKLKLRPINPGNTTKFDIIAVDSGENLGSISISSQGWPFVDLAMLKKEYIGKNLATEIYNALEHRIKRPIIPSPLGLSDKATKFWQRRLAAMPVEHAKQLLDESLAAGKSYGIRDKHIIDRLQPLLAEWQPPNITARIQELSAKRLPGAAPTMFWHGTSSKFLQSIMLNGLDPAKIKEGNWRVDPANKLEAGKDYSQTNKMTVAARLLELHAAAIKSSPLKLNAFNEGSEHLALLEEYQASGRKGANSTDINQHLSGRQKLSGKALKVAQRSIRHIDKIFAMQPAQHAGGHVYRAVVINPDEFQIGKTYRSNAYTSTSTNRKYITRTFFRPNKKANSSYVLFNLNLPPNYPLLNLSKWGDEGEHLLPRGIKFRVIDKRINSGYTEIYLDVYPK